MLNTNGPSKIASERERIWSSVKSLLVRGVGQRGIGAVSGIALAFFLSAGDYGILLQAGIIAAAARLFTLQGLQAFLIQERRYSEEQLFGTVFVVDVCVHLAASLLLILYATLATSGQLQTIVLMQAAVLIVTGATRSSMSLLKRQLRFDRLSHVQLVGSVVTAVTRIGSASIGFGAVSMVLGELLGAALTSGVLLMTCRVHRWAGHLSFVVLRDAYWFVRHTMAASLSMFGATQADKIIVSAALSPDAAGVYYFASSQAGFLLTLLLTPQQDLLLSLYARRKADLSRCRTLLYNSLMLYGTLGVAVYGVALLVAPVFIPLVFGQRWEPAVPVFQVFCLGYLVQILPMPAMPVLTAFGRPDLLTRMKLLKSVGLIAVLGFAVRWESPLILALACSLTAFVSDCLQAVLSLRTVEMTLRRAAAACLPGACGVLLLLGVAGSADLTSSGTGPVIIRAAVFAFSLGVCLAVFWARDWVRVANALLPQSTVRWLGLVQRGAR